MNNREYQQKITEWDRFNARRDKLRRLLDARNNEEYCGFKNVHEYVAHKNKQAKIEAEVEKRVEEAEKQRRLEKKFKEADAILEPRFEKILSKYKKSNDNIPGIKKQVLFDDEIEGDNNG